MQLQAAPQKQARRRVHGQRGESRRGAVSSAGESGMGTAAVSGPASGEIWLELINKRKVLLFWSMNRRGGRLCARHESCMRPTTLSRSRVDQGRGQEELRLGWLSSSGGLMDHSIVVTATEAQDSRFIFHRRVSWKASRLGIKPFGDASIMAQMIHYTSCAWGHLAKLTSSTLANMTLRSPHEQHINALPLGSTRVTAIQLPQLSG